MSRRTATLPERPEESPAKAIEELELALAADAALLPPSGPEPNLLHIGWIGRMFRSRLYPGVFQAAGMVVFGVVMLATLFGPTAVADNFGSTVVWILWWPLLPLSYFLFSRFWCTVCPYPVVGEWFQRLTGVNLQVPAIPQEVRDLDHRPDVPLHHLGRPRVRHRRVAARHRLPAAGDARRRHRHEPVLRAPRLLQPPLLPRRPLGQLLDDLAARLPRQPRELQEGGLQGPLVRQRLAARGGVPPVRDRRARWTPTATATCAATA